jgi:beta-lactamase regulating signal transducer with metallopeptidase domain
MASLMSYCALVALLMSLAAFVIERLLTTHGRAHRIVWVIALVVSLAYPAARILSPPQLPRSPVLRPAATTEAPKSAVLIAPSTTQAISQPPASPIQPRPYVQRRHFIWPDLASWNQTLVWLWIASTAGVLVFYALGWLRLLLMSRRWTLERVNGTSVQIADDLGPAVVGFFKPRIVLPCWLLSAPADQRTMAFDHERQHVAAQDSRLLYIALLLLALAPWNLPLWWQLRRLRFAIEVDCDRRVLQTGTNPKDYGEMLLSIGQRRRGSMTGTLALTEKTSQLERRIHIITGAATRYSRSAPIAVLGVLISLVVAAAALDAPKPNFAPSLRRPPGGDMSPLGQRGREVSRAQFPELFDRKIPGDAVVVVVFNNDGSLFSATKKEIPPGALPDALKEWAQEIPAGSDPEDIVAGSTQDEPIGAWADSKNPYRVILVNKVLRWPVDPTRSTARVKQAVRAYFPDLLQVPEYSLTLVTVFMNEDGTIKRGEKKVFPPGTMLSADSGPQFADLGVVPEDMGRHSSVNLWEPNSVETRFIGVNFAWPRRGDDRPEDPNHWWYWRNPPPPASSEETPEDRAVLARYFPGVLENGVRDGMGLWVLVARDGTILKTGQSLRGHLTTRDKKGRLLRENSQLLADRELQARYPGIMVGGCDYGGMTHQISVHDQKIPLDYACLRIESPVTDLRRVDTAKRPDAFIGGKALDSTFGDTRRNFTFVLTPTFGELATSELFHSVQAVATDVGPNELELKLRQHPHFTETWSDWSSPIRVTYDQETTVEVPDHDSGNIKLVLRPIRLKDIE